MKIEQINQYKTKSHPESCGPQLLRISLFLNKMKSILRSRCSESQPLSINSETPESCRWQFRGWKRGEQRDPRLQISGMESKRKTLNNNLSGWTLLYQGGINFMTAISNDRKAGDPELRPLRMTLLCNTKAFTLIELLVVVLIIGILAAIALPQYQLAVYKTRYAGIIQMMKAIKQANQVYFMANGAYTNDVSAWDIDFPQGTSFPNKNGTIGTIILANGDRYEVVSARQTGIPVPRVQGWCKDCPGSLWTAYAYNQWTCYPNGTDLGARLCRSFGAKDCKKTDNSCEFSF